MASGQGQTENVSTALKFWLCVVSKCCQGDCCQGANWFMVVIVLTLG